MIELDCDSKNVQRFERWLERHMKSLRKRVRAGRVPVTELFVPPNMFVAVVRYEGLYGRGVARCMPDDDLDSTVGVELATDRAINAIADKIFAKEVSSNILYKAKMRIESFPDWKGYK